MARVFNILIQNPPVAVQFLINVSHIFSESLDDLEKLCCDLFAAVENKNVASPEWKEHPFGPDQLQKKGFIVPVKDIRNLNITFPMPDMREHYESQVVIVVT